MRTRNLICDLDKFRYAYVELAPKSDTAEMNSKKRYNLALASGDLPEEMLIAKHVPLLVATDEGVHCVINIHTKMSLRHAQMSPARSMPGWESRRRRAPEDKKTF